MPTYPEKLARLEAHLRELDCLAVAFSGGVDSSVLLHAARRVLGERAIGVLADSVSLPRRELRLAREVAAAMGAELVEVRTDELQDADYQANLGQRCYFCKAALFRAMCLFYLVSLVTYESSSSMMMMMASG